MKRTILFIIIIGIFTFFFTVRVVHALTDSYIANIVTTASGTPVAAYQTPVGFVGYVTSPVTGEVYATTTGSEVWRVRNPSTDYDSNITIGPDVNADGYRDVILSSATEGPTVLCAGATTAHSRLSLLSGATGGLLFSAKMPNCATFNGQTFPYTQLFHGSLLFGAFNAIYYARQYENQGWALQFTPSGTQQSLGTTLFPSGHSANGLVVGSANNQRLIFFTSERVMQYTLASQSNDILSPRYNTPFYSHRSTTDDYNDGGTALCYDGCRNYGAVVSIPTLDKVILVSGIGSYTLLSDTKAGGRVTDPWGAITRHVDVYNSATGVVESSRYYSYAHDPNESYVHQYGGRVTYPAHLTVTVGGTTYVLFNVYNAVDSRSDTSVDDRWYVSVNRVASNGTLIEQKIYNTYVWDVIVDQDGTPVVVGTETSGYWPRVRAGNFETKLGILSSDGSSLNWFTTRSGLPKIISLGRSETISYSAGREFGVAVGQEGVLTETVTPPILPSYVTPPTLSIAASPTNVTSGQNSIVSWSCGNTPSCVIKKNGALLWSGPSGQSAFNTGPLTSAALFSIEASGFSTATIIGILPPSLSISAAPASVATGQGSIVSWSCGNTPSCVIKKNGALLWSGGPGQSAFTTGSLNGTTVYSIEASGVASSTTITTF